MKNHIVIIASEFKGNEFIDEAQKAGWHVTLVTREDLHDKHWTWASLDEVRYVPKEAREEEYLRAVVKLAAEQPIQNIVGMDEFDVLPAARAREYLQIFKGLSRSHALCFRDKLLMRLIAASNGIDCPEFIGIFNPKDINDYLEKVPSPWIIKPRTEVSAFGIRKCEDAEQIWNVLTELDSRNTWRDHPSKYQIEKFIEGDVYHVDSIIRNGRVIASGVNEYGTTPFDVARGGVFTSSTMDYKSKDRKKLERLNRKLLKAFKYEKGVSHAEFLKSEKDGKFYLLEVAARVGGAYIANIHEHANGFNLWREWAKLETATEENPYRKPNTRKEYAGIALALANRENPDTSHYTDEEIVYRVDKPNHVGLIFHSKSKERLEELLAEYRERITNDLLKIAPVKERYDA